MPCTAKTPDVSAKITVVIFRVNESDYHLGGLTQTWTTLIFTSPEDGTCNTCHNVSKSSFL
jgi:hypothetical protein